jgi:EmrB/QacA subfamily drug resistance transporter
MIVPLIVGCAQFMQMLDSTVIATALPAMAKSMGEDPVKLNVAITAYLLSAAVFVPICGWAADRFGARRVFATAMILFAFSSVLCGMSNTLTEMVAGRALQGFAGAMMVPVGRIVLLRSVDKTQIVQAMSFLSIPALIGPICGPAVGGFMVEYWSWRWIFYINVPISMIGVMLTLRYIKDVASGPAQPLDYIGFVLSAVGLGSLVFCFEAVGRGVVTTATLLGLAALGSAAAVLYVVHSRRARFPILDFGLLKTHTFAIAVGGGNLCRLAVGAVPFLLAMQLQVVFGLGALAAGMLTFVGAVGSLMMKISARPILRRFGFRRALIGNAVLTGFSVIACVLFTPSTPHSVIIVVLLLGGFFRSLQLTGVNSLAYADITPLQMGRATGMASAAQQLAISMGVAVSAFTLKSSMTLRGGDELAANDVMWAFLVVGCLMLTSVLFFRKLAHNAGDEVSGKIAAH